MIWINSLITTTYLIVLVSLLAGTIGIITAVAAWWSNRTWAYYVPLLVLAVPPWLLSYYMSDQFGYIDPWIGSTLSLGLCCSVYPHSLISASLANRAHKNLEMLFVTRGRTWSSLVTAIWPSLKLSFLPSIALVAAECVADFGVSNFYGLNTVTMLTYNIYTSTWNIGQMIWGVGLLAVMGMLISKLDLINVAPLISDTTVKHNNFWILAIAPTVAIIGFGFYTSLNWIFVGASFFTDDFAKELLNSLYLVAVVSLICLATTVVYIRGLARHTLERVGLAAYALPGTVIGAVWLYLGGSWIPMFILLSIAIATRYFGLIVNSVAVACKGSQRYFEVVDTYAVTYQSRFKEKIKIVAPSMIIGVCLIVLDVLRELPISMLLQPMNFQTLAMRMNYLARNEAIPSLGPHSLVIVSLGLLLCAVIIKVTYDRNSKS